MEAFADFMKRPFIRRITVLAIAALLLYFVRGQITLLLLTYIFVYFFDSAQKFVTAVLNRFFHMDKRAVIAFLYLVMAGFLFLFFYNYVPEIIVQITNILNSVTNFILNIDTAQDTGNLVLNYIYDYLQRLDLDSYVTNNTTRIIGLIGDVGTIGMNVLMAALLSLFYLLQKDRISVFLRGFRSSKISWIYDEMSYFSNKFSNSFGKVIQTQIIISLVNSAVSVVILAFLGFPNTIGLFMMIFILGMVPVAGAIISIVPLSIVAYSVGGVRYIIYILILGVVLHSLESYVLNPKLMSHKTKLPVFIVFLILILSEHLMGIWGLIVGIPITVFILDVLEVRTEGAPPPDSGAESV